MSDLAIIILAAGKGTRMHSNKPKVLQPLAGKPWILHLVENAQHLKPAATYMVVSPDNREPLALALSEYNCHFVEQAQTLGTAHAVLQALPKIKAENTLILVGDVPLLKSETLHDLVSHTPIGGIGMLTFEPENPTGLGRVLRDEQGHILRIIEEKDASLAEKALREAAVGVYFAPTTLLNILLPQINNQNAAGEYYLPDFIPLAIKAKHKVHGIKIHDAMQGFGINTKHQLAIAERYFQKQQVEQLMGQGLTVIDPERVDIRGKLTVKSDVTLDINVIIEGEVFIGEGCVIGAHSILRNVHLGDFVKVEPYSIIENSIIENDCIVGPFARIRPGCHLHAQSHVGNFVELKNAQLGRGSKIKHLSYVGDTETGEGVKIGAGTITCNYDGTNKHKTQIKDHAFIGSNVSLIAPISIGENAVIGAGSVLTENAPEGELTLARAKQISIKRSPEEVT